MSDFKRKLDVETSALEVGNVATYSKRVAILDAAAHLHESEVSALREENGRLSKDLEAVRSSLDVEDYARRHSLAQEITEGLRARGHWAPADASSDVILAVFKAVDALREENEGRRKLLFAKADELAAEWHRAEAAEARADGLRRDREDLAVALGAQHAVNLGLRTENDRLRADLSAQIKRLGEQAGERLMLRDRIRALEGALGRIEHLRDAYPAATMREIAREALR